MAIHALQRSQMTRSAPKTMQVATFPSPTGGMDSRQNLAAEDMTLCIYSYNLNPAEYGMAVRAGYRRYQSNVANIESDGVRTLIPYRGLATDNSDDKLFAVTNEGIFDVTVDQDPPVLRGIFPITTGDAGYGVFTDYVTDAGVNLSFYADSVNGLWTFDPDLGVWLPTENITGVDTLLVNFVMIHKQRLWLGVQAEATAYYLPVGSIAGAATPFYFGSKFTHGGELVGLWNWTVDGGDGVDDYLVVVSRGGDVLPYQGTDPEDVWDNTGSYYIGDIPRGKKIGSQYGGDLIFLSEFGVTAMSDLLRSSAAVDPSAASVTFKISSLIRASLRIFRNEVGWELEYLPTQALLILQMPINDAGVYEQFILMRTTGGWAYWRTVPMSCVTEWRGAAMFGTANNTVERMDAERDAVVQESGDVGHEIPFSILTNYSGLGSNGMYKRCEFIRPTFTGSGNVTFTVQPYYDYQVSEAPLPPILPENSTGVWDLSDWDGAEWGSDEIHPTFAVRGALGLGRAIAVGISGLGETGTWLITIDLMWRSGGEL